MSRRSRFFFEGEETETSLVVSLSQQHSEPACDEWTPLHAGVCAGVYEMNDVFGSVFDFFFMKIYLIKCARTCFSLYIMYAYYSCCCYYYYCCYYCY